jgi:predicted RNase H-like nuclease (RuvC/YqgF family)
MVLIQIRLSPEVIDYVREFGKKHGKLIDDTAFRLFAEYLEKQELESKQLKTEIKAKDFEIKLLKKEIKEFQKTLENHIGIERKTEE